MPGRKPFKEMFRNAPPEMMEVIVKRNGLPDLFAESAEGTIFGLPNIYADPSTRLAIQGLDCVISEGFSDVKKGLEHHK